MKMGHHPERVCASFANSKEMPVQQIINSSKIDALGFKAHFNLATGFILVDLSPSVWKPGGANSVQGASLVLISPSGRVLSSGSTNVWTPPMTGTVSVPLPQFNNVFEWGVYQFRVTLTESAGKLQVIESTFDLCAPQDNDKKTGEACIDAQPDCDDGVLRLYMGLQKYKGFGPITWSNAYQLFYPQAAGVSPVQITNFPIEVNLITGTSIIQGQSTGYFDCGSNYFVTALYTANQEIYCSCEFPCHLWCAYKDLVDLVASCDTGTEEHSDSYDKLVNVEHYVTLVIFGHKCGKDVSEYIKILEDLLGVQDSCAPTVIGTTRPTTTTTTLATTTTTTTQGTSTTSGTTTTTTSGTTTNGTTTQMCATVTDIEASFGGVVPLANIYFGSSPDNHVLTGNEILAGSSSGQDPTGQLSLDWSAMSSPAFLWFAIPVPNTKTQWYVSVINNGNIGTPDDLFGAPTVITVSGRDYNLYQSNYATQFTQICLIS